MKRLGLILLLGGISSGVISAQAPYSSPYAMFEDTTVKSPKEVWVYHYGDTLSIFERAEYDRTSYIAVFYGKNDSLGHSNDLKPLKIVKWGVDPLAAKAPGWSPYRAFFCNPIYWTDPTGAFEDDYQVDNQGNIVLLRETDDDFDVLYNSDETQSIQLQKGILGNQYSQNAKGADGSWFSYDIMKVRGDETATNLFEFLANNTKVEWSFFQLGIAGDQGLNYLTTSHEKSTERGGTQMINTQFQYGYTIRSHTHNHPGNTAMPSGLTDKDGKMAGEWGDIGFSKSVENWYMSTYPSRTTPIFRIYTASDAEYIQYNKNSTIHDFSPIITMPEMIIKP